LSAAESGRAGSGWRGEALPSVLLLLAPLLWLYPVTLGGRTALPVDNLAQYAPWDASAAQFGFEAGPHNALISDLVLENYMWQRFVRESVRAGELPLWNPYQFAGAPFLATGQASALYPPSVLFHLLPLTLAYGWYLMLHFALAGVLTYALVRGLGLGSTSALLAGIAYQGALPLTASSVFPMIVSGAAWLPLLLLAVLRVGTPAVAPAGWLCVGALAIGMQLLAGHPEVAAYSLIVAALLGAWQLLAAALQHFTDVRGQLLRAATLLAMVALGFGIGAVQFLPQLEAVRGSSRTQAPTLDTVRGWALPLRHVLAFFAPNIFGNPSVHGYWDLFSATWVAGKPVDWGIKNFVEGAIYLGALPLLLAGGAVVRQAMRIRRAFGGDRRAQIFAPSIFFGLLALLCLAFAFGSPLYALVYYLPGLSQLHTPFRWMLPFALCVAVLAAYGVEDQIAQSRTGRFGTLAACCVGVGSVLVLAVLLMRVFFAQFAPVFDELVQRLALAGSAFADGRMFFSFTGRWVLQAAVVLALSGLALALLRATQATQGALRTACLLAVPVFVAVDLALAISRFLPANVPEMLQFEPPVIAFLRSDRSAWRYTTYDPEGSKPLNANSGWLFDLQDVRGYDSTIPLQYVNYMQQLEPQSELQYNRIAPLRSAAALNSPLLDLLNVRYVLTRSAIESPGYTLVHNGDLRVYRNERVLPRAFMLAAGCAFAAQDVTGTLLDHDLRYFLMLEPGSVLATAPVLPLSDCEPQAARITSYANSEVRIAVQVSAPAYLMLADSFAPGWRAYVQGAAGTAPVEVPVLRADGNFRAVLLQPGAQSVRFKYSPDAVKLGGLLSFTAVMAWLLILAGSWWTQRQSEVAASGAARVARNSLAPMGFNLLNRAIDFVFAAYYLRVLGPGAAGDYTTAIVLVGWYEIWTNFGLNAWLTRAAAQDLPGANRYFSNSNILRIALAGLSMPVFLGAVFWYQAGTGALGAETVLSVALLAVGMFLSSLSSGLTALFYAYEQAEVPAAVSVGTTLLKVLCGTAALVLGYGFVGLAGVSIIVNAFTLLILAAYVRLKFFVPRTEYTPALQRTMIVESFPLMLNHLLATLFFKIDVPLLRTLRGDAEVGRYGAAYKFLDAFNVIPSFFTFALFPLLSRQAQQDRPAMLRTYHFAIKLLTLVALPVAAAAWWLAAPLVGLLGGQAYLPDGAFALQLMALSMPFGWINSVTNYLLVAAGQQRALTRCFAVAVLFNLGANLLFIPRYGYVAAAVITILSELVEGAAFQYFVYRHIAPTPWLRLFGRAGMAAAAMLAALWLGAQLHVALGLLLTALVYPAALLALRVFDDWERAQLWAVLPPALRDLVKV
jgi:O-antigen/teichoic acid export membrane protein